MRAWVAEVVQRLDLIVLLYFLALQIVYLGFAVTAFAVLLVERRRWSPLALDAFFRSPAAPALTIIAPAHNEEATIEESVRGLLLTNYPSFEVVVVNDGSTDGTVAALVARFHLLQAPLAYPEHVRTKPVRAVYRSPDIPNLVVIDKVNGGKADALNAGLNAARHTLVSVIDADSLLEEQALMRVVQPFVEDPDVVATGGIIRVVNSCSVEAGRVTRVALPRNWLARFQVIEYLRAYLSSRVAMAALNTTLIISGAFGVFRRQLVIEAGGFQTDTIGEDMELVVRLHRLERERGRTPRVAFRPDAVCWTEVPESCRVLRSQRNRWQRGTCQVLQAHARMIGNPRYGAVGLFGMTYYLLFEALGPLVEVTGLVTLVVGWYFGLVDPVFAQLFMLLAVGCGVIMSLLAVALEEMTFRRYTRLTDVLLLTSLAVLENLGYRQLTLWWRLRGTWDFLRRRRHGWGTMTRKGFGRESLGAPVVTAESGTPNRG